MTSIGEISVDLKLDTTYFDRQVVDIGKKYNTVAINARLKTESLETEFRRYQEKLQQKTIYIPTEVRLDPNQVKKIQEQLRSQSLSISVGIQDDGQALTKNISTAIQKGFDGIRLNQNKGLFSSLTGLLLSPFKLVTGLIGNIFTGIGFSIGAPIGKEIGQGLLQGIQKESGDFIGSFNLIGKTLGEGLTDELITSLGRARTPIKRMLNDIAGEIEVATESAAQRAQAQQRSSRTASQGQKQLQFESGQLSSNAQSLQSERATLFQAKPIQLKSLEDKLNEKIRQVEERLKIKDLEADLSAALKRLTSVKQNPFAISQSIGKIQKKVEELRKKITDKDLLGLSDQDVTKIEGQIANELARFKRVNNTQIAVNGQISKLSGAVEKVQNRIDGIKEEVRKLFTNEIKAFEEASEKLDKEQFDFTRKIAPIGQLKKLSQNKASDPLAQLLKFVADKIAALQGFDKVSSSRLPTIKVESAASFKERGQYIPEANILKLREDVYETLMAGATNIKDLETLVHELVHGFQTGFGKLDIGEAIRTGKMATPVATPTKAELQNTDIGQRIEQSVGANYSQPPMVVDYIRKAETDAYTRATRIVNKVFEDLKKSEGFKSLQSEMGVGGGKLLNQLNKIPGKVNALKEILQENFAILPEQYIKFILTEINQISSQGVGLIADTRKLGAKLLDIDAIPVDEIEGFYQEVNNNVNKVGSLSQKTELVVKSVLDKINAANAQVNQQGQSSAGSNAEDLLANAAEIQKNIQSKIKTAFKGKGKNKQVVNLGIAHEVVDSINKQITAIDELLSTNVAAELKKGLGRRRGNLEMQYRAYAHMVKEAQYKQTMQSSSTPIGARSPSPVPNINLYDAKSLDAQSETGKFLVQYRRQLQSVDMAGESKRLGAEFGKGLNQGLRLSVEQVRSASKNLAQEVVEATKETLEIQSPSRVARRLGRFFGQGLSLGIAGEESSVIKQAEKIVSGLTGVFKKTDKLKQTSFTPQVTPISPVVQQRAIPQRVPDARVVREVDRAVDSIRKTLKTGVGTTLGTSLDAFASQLQFHIQRLEKVADQNISDAAKVLVQRRLNAIKKLEEKLKNPALIAGSTASTAIVPVDELTKTKTALAEAVKIVAKINKAFQIATQEGSEITAVKFTAYLRNYIQKLEEITQRNIAESTKLVIDRRIAQIKKLEENFKKSSAIVPVRSSALAVIPPLEPAPIVLSQPKTSSIVRQPESSVSGVVPQSRQELEAIYKDLIQSQKVKEKIANLLAKGSGVPVQSNISTLAPRNSLPVFDESGATKAALDKAVNAVAKINQAIQVSVSQGVDVNVTKLTAYIRKYIQRLEEAAQESITESTRLIINKRVAQAKKLEEGLRKSVAIAPVGSQSLTVFVPPKIPAPAIDDVTTTKAALSEAVRIVAKINQAFKVAASQGVDVSVTKLTAYVQKYTQRLEEITQGNIAESTKLVINKRIAEVKKIEERLKKSVAIVTVDTNAIDITSEIKSLEKVLAQARRTADGINNAIKQGVGREFGVDVNDFNSQVQKYIKELESILDKNINDQLRLVVNERISKMKKLQQDIAKKPFALTYTKERSNTSLITSPLQTQVIPQPLNENNNSRSTALVPFQPKPLTPASRQPRSLTPFSNSTASATPVVSGETIEQNIINRYKSSYSSLKSDFDLAKGLNTDGGKITREIQRKIETQIRSIVRQLTDKTISDETKNVLQQLMKQLQSIGVATTSSSSASGASVKSQDYTPLVKDVTMHLLTLKQKLKNLTGLGTAEIKSAEELVASIESHLSKFELAEAKINRRLSESGDVKLGDRIKAAFKPAEDFLKKMGVPVDDLAGKVGTLLKGFLAFRSAAFMQDLLRKLTQGSFEAFLQVDRLKTALSFSSGGITQGASALKFVREEVERLRIPMTPAIEGFTQLSAATRGTAVEGKATRQVFTGMSEAATVLGMTSDQLSGAIMAVSQMASKGKVQAEELRGQLGERLPGALGIAARAMGVTEAQLNKMMETGNLLASDFLPRFGAQLHAEFGEAAKTASGNAQSAVFAFQNAWQRLQENLGEGLAPGTVLGMNALSSAMNVAVQGGASLAQALSAVSVVMAAKLIPPVWKLLTATPLLKAAGGVVTSTFGSMAGMLATAAKHFTALYLAFELWNRASILINGGEVAQEFKKMEDAANKAADAVGALGSLVERNKLKEKDKPAKSDDSSWKDKVIDYARTESNDRHKGTWMPINLIGGLKKDQEEDADRASESIWKAGGKIRSALIDARGMANIPLVKMETAAIANVDSQLAQVGQQRQAIVNQINTMYFGLTPPKELSQKLIQLKEQFNNLSNQRATFAEPYTQALRNLELSAANAKAQLELLNTPGGEDAFRSDTRNDQYKGHRVEDIKNELRSQINLAEEAVTIINQQIANTNVDPITAITKAFKAFSVEIALSSEELQKSITLQQQELATDQTSNFSRTPFASQIAGLKNAKLEIERLTKEIQNQQDNIDKRKRAFDGSPVLQGLGLNSSSSAAEIQKVSDLLPEDQEATKGVLEKLKLIRDDEVKLSQLRTQLAQAGLAELQQTEAKKLAIIQQGVADRDAALRRGEDAGIANIRKLQLERKLTEQQAAEEIARLSLSTTNNQIKNTETALAAYKYQYDQGTISAANYVDKERELTTQLSGFKKQKAEQEIAYRESVNQRLLGDLDRTNKSAEQAITASQNSQLAQVKQMRLNRQITDQQMAVQVDAIQKRRTADDIALLNWRIGEEKRLRNLGLRNYVQSLDLEKQLREQLGQANLRRIDEEIQAQKNLQELAVKNIEKRTQTAVTALQYQSQQADRVLAGFKNLTALNTAQNDLGSALRSLAEQRIQQKANEAKTDSGRKKFEIDLAKLRLTNIQTAQKAALKTLEITQAQRRVELAREVILARIAQLEAKAALSKAIATGATKQEIAGLRQVLGLREQVTKLAMGAQKGQGKIDKLELQTFGVKSRGEREQAVSDIKVKRKEYWETVAKDKEKNNKKVVKTERTKDRLEKAGERVTTLKSKAKIRREQLEQNQTNLLTHGSTSTDPEKQAAALRRNTEKYDRNNAKEAIRRRKEDTDIARATRDYNRLVQSTNPNNYKPKPAPVKPRALSRNISPKTKPALDLAKRLEITDRESDFGKQRQKDNKSRLNKWQRSSANRLAVVLSRSNQVLSQINTTESERIIAAKEGKKNAQTIAVIQRQVNAQKIKVYQSQISEVGKLRGIGALTTSQSTRLIASANNQITQLRLKSADREKQAWVKDRDAAIKAVQNTTSIKLDTIGKSEIDRTNAVQKNRLRKRITEDQEQIQISRIQADSSRQQIKAYQWRISETKKLMQRGFVSPLAGKQIIAGLSREISQIENKGLASSTNAWERLRDLKIRAIYSANANELAAIKTSENKRIAAIQNAVNRDEKTQSQANAEIAAVKSDSTSKQIAALKKQSRQTQSLVKQKLLTPLQGSQRVAQLSQSISSLQRESAERGAKTIKQRQQNWSQRVSQAFTNISNNVAARLDAIQRKEDKQLTFIETERTKSHLTEAQTEAQTSSVRRDSAKAQAAVYRWQLAQIKLAGKKGMLSASAKARAIEDIEQKIAQADLQGVKAGSELFKTNRSRRLTQLASSNSKELNAIKTRENKRIADAQGDKKLTSQTRQSEILKAQKESFNSQIGLLNKRNKQLKNLASQKIITTQDANLGISANNQQLWSLKKRSGSLESQAFQKQQQAWANRGNKAVATINDKTATWLSSVDKTTKDRIRSIQLAGIKSNLTDAQVEAAIDKAKFESSRKQIQAYTWQRTQVQKLIKDKLITGASGNRIVAGLSDKIADLNLENATLKRSDWQNSKNKKLKDLATRDANELSALKTASNKRIQGINDAVKNKELTPSRANAEISKIQSDTARQQANLFKKQRSQTQSLVNQKLLTPLQGSQRNARLTESISELLKKSGDINRQAIARKQQAWSNKVSQTLGAISNGIATRLDKIQQNEDKQLNDIGKRRGRYELTEQQAENEISKVRSNSAKQQVVAYNWQLSQIKKAVSQRLFTKVAGQRAIADVEQKKQQAELQSTESDNKLFQSNRNNILSQYAKSSANQLSAIRTRENNRVGSIQKSVNGKELNPVVGRAQIAKAQQSSINEQLNLLKSQARQIKNFVSSRILTKQQGDSSLSDISRQSAELRKRSTDIVSRSIQRVRQDWKDRADKSVSTVNNKTATWLATIDGNAKNKIRAIEQARVDSRLTEAQAENAIAKVGLESKRKQVQAYEWQRKQFVGLIGKKLISGVTGKRTLTELDDKISNLRLDANKQLSAVWQSNKNRQIQELGKQNATELSNLKAASNTRTKGIWDAVKQGELSSSAGNAQVLKIQADATKAQVVVLKRQLGRVKKLTDQKVFTKQEGGRLTSQLNQQISGLGLEQSRREKNAVERGRQAFAKRASDAVKKSQEEFATNLSNIQSDEKSRTNKIRIERGRHNLTEEQAEKQILAVQSDSTKKQVALYQNQIKKTQSLIDKRFVNKVVGKRTIAELGNQIEELTESGLTQQNQLFQKNLAQRLRVISQANATVLTGIKNWESQQKKAILDRKGKGDITAAKAQSLIASVEAQSAQKQIAALRKQIPQIQGLVKSRQLTKLQGSDRTRGINETIGRLNVFASSRRNQSREILKQDWSSRADKAVKKLGDEFATNLSSIQSNEKTQTNKIKISRQNFDLTEDQAEKQILAVQSQSTKQQVALYRNQIKQTQSLIDKGFLGRVVGKRSIADLNNQIQELIDSGLTQQNQLFQKNLTQRLKAIAQANTTVISGIKTSANQQKKAINDRKAKGDISAAKAQSLIASVDADSAQKQVIALRKQIPQINQLVKLRQLTKLQGQERLRGINSQIGGLNAFTASRRRQSVDVLRQDWTKRGNDALAGINSKAATALNNIQTEENKRTYTARKLRQGYGITDEQLQNRILEIQKDSGSKQIATLVSQRDGIQVLMKKNFVTRADGLKAVAELNRRISEVDIDTGEKSEQLFKANRTKKLSAIASGNATELSAIKAWRNQQITAINKRRNLTPDQSQAAISAVEKQFNKRQTDLINKRIGQVEGLVEQKVLTSTEGSKQIAELRNQRSNIIKQGSEREKQAWLKRSSGVVKTINDKSATWLNIVEEQLNDRITKIKTSRSNFDLTQEQADTQIAEAQKDAATRTANIYRWQQREIGKAVGKRYLSSTAGNKIISDIGRKVGESNLTVANTRNELFERNKARRIAEINARDARALAKIQQDNTKRLVSIENARKGRELTNEQAAVEAAKSQKQATNEQKKLIQDRIKRTRTLVKERILTSAEGSQKVSQLNQQSSQLTQQQLQRDKQVSDKRQQNWIKRRDSSIKFVNNKTEQWINAATQQQDDAINNIKQARLDSNLTEEQADAAILKAQLAGSKKIGDAYHWKAKQTELLVKRGILTAPAGKNILTQIGRDAARNKLGGTESAVSLFQKNRARQLREVDNINATSLSKIKQVESKTISGVNDRLKRNDITADQAEKLILQARLKSIQDQKGLLQRRTQETKKLVDKRLLTKQEGSLRIGQFSQQSASLTRTGTELEKQTGNKLKQSWVKRRDKAVNLVSNNSQAWLDAIATQENTTISGARKLRLRFKLTEDEVDKRIIQAQKLANQKRIQAYDYRIRKTEELLERGMITAPVATSTINQLKKERSEVEISGLEQENQLFQKNKTSKLTAINNANTTALNKIKQAETADINAINKNKSLSAEQSRGQILAAQKRSANAQKALLQSRIAQSKNLVKQGLLTSAEGSKRESDFKNQTANINRNTQEREKQAWVKRRDDRLKLVESSANTEIDNLESEENKRLLAIKQAQLLGSKTDEQVAIDISNLQVQGAIKRRKLTEKQIAETTELTKGGYYTQAQGKERTAELKKRYSSNQLEEADKRLENQNQQRTVALNKIEDANFKAGNAVEQATVARIQALKRLQVAGKITEEQAQKDLLAIQVANTEAQIKLVHQRIATEKDAIRTRLHDAKTGQRALIELNNELARLNGDRIDQELEGQRIVREDAQRRLEKELSTRQSIVTWQIDYNQISSSLLQSQNDLISAQNGLKAAQLNLEQQRLDFALRDAEASGNQAKVDELRWKILQANAKQSQEDYQFKLKQIEAQQVLNNLEYQRSQLQAQVAIIEAENAIQQAKLRKASGEEIDNLYRVLDIRKRQADLVEKQRSFQLQTLDVTKQQLSVENQIAKEKQAQDEKEYKQEKDKRGVPNASLEFAGKSIDQITASTQEGQSRQISLVQAALANKGNPAFAQALEQRNYGDAAKLADSLKNANQFAVQSKIIQAQFSNKDILTELRRMAEIMERNGNRPTTLNVSSPNPVQDAASIYSGLSKNATRASGL